MILEATCTDPQKNTLASHNYLSWTQERWEGILEFKRRFLQNPREDPRQCPYLSQEVANSWIRCQKLGIDPKGSIMHRQLTHDQYQKILDENQLLINITRPLINTLSILHNEHIQNSQGFILG